MTDQLTTDWCRGPADEKAVEHGCRFDLERASWPVFWIERYCKLYEGEYAGQPLILVGCHECDFREYYAVSGDWWEDADQTIPGPAQLKHAERAAKYIDCRSKGHHVDWQYECVMRLFGWVKTSEHWSREIRRFRFASIWGGKKIKKTPTVSALALYLTIGDAEPGNKVFLAGKDGSQIRKNMSEHIVAMRDQSPELVKATTLNKTSLRISFSPLRSWLEPLSSSNVRTQQSKEGLNGSVIVDECHVVDRALISRINRAGISRAEPLHIEVSTAGDDPDGYGFEQFQKAVSIVKGEQFQDNFFAAVYAAPQDLSDAELEADPLKYGRMANPAMGHTVSEEEFLQDYDNSKKATLYEFGRFKMYRLNIWQRSAHPWLKGSDWASCKHSFTEEDLYGRECYAGLDLARKRDMSALVLCFPGGYEGDDPEAYALLPYFWLPEVIAKERDAQVSFLAWAAQGLLYLTPGNVIDFGYIKATVRRLAEKFKIRLLAYDETYAEDLTQSIEQGVMDDAGKVIEEATGIPRMPFRQSLMEFASPTTEFERLVMAGKLHHNGHKVLSWQAGHVQVKSDANNNIRPVKPQHGDIRKIDGIVAGIMALAHAVKGETEKSVYEDGKGLLVL